MENFDYKNICSELIANLSGKQKETILRRFGLKRAQKETLEAIGRDFGVCRERVRQIQSASLDRISPKLEKHDKVFQYFLKHLKSFGGLRKESVLLEELGGHDNQNEVFFLLSLKEPFKRINKNNDFYSCWITDESYFGSAKKTISSLFNQLQKIKKPLPVANLKSSLKRKALLSVLDISKKIHPNEEGFYGLSNWPEINPKGIKGRAYLVFKKAKKPLHFKEVTELIEGSHIQTVHNELIKDPRFVLVGRGTYALSEWGYYPGQVKDVIFNILKQAPKPLTKEEILGKVLKQRIVKENTVLLNLNNKNHFLRDTEGKYTVKEI